MSVARIRHVAMPLLEAGNQPSSAWCKRPGRPFMENRQEGTCQSCLPASERILSSARLERTMAGPWMRWEQPGGLASTGARTSENDCSPEIRLPAEAVAADNSMRRPRFLWGQAEVFREETGKSTGRASRGMGPSACARIAELTSGRAISQQGLATTCKDSSDQGKPEVDERDLAWRMSLLERRRRGNALRAMLHLGHPRSNPGALRCCISSGRGSTLVPGDAASRASGSNPVPGDAVSRTPGVEPRSRRYQRTECSWSRAERASCRSERQGGGHGAASPRRRRVAQPTARRLRWHHFLGARHPTFIGEHCLS
jgi:hypothetical protein